VSVKPQTTTALGRRRPLPPRAASRSWPVSSVAPPAVLAAPQPREQRQPEWRGDQEQQGDGVHFQPAPAVREPRRCAFPGPQPTAKTRVGACYAISSVGTPSVGGPNHNPRQNGSARDFLSSRTRRVPLVFDIASPRLCRPGRPAGQNRTAETMLAAVAAELRRSDSREDRHRHRGDRCEGNEARMTDTA
jgi:hypothetical protein